MVFSFWVKDALRVGMRRGGASLLTLVCHSCWGGGRHFHSTPKHLQRLKTQHFFIGTYIPTCMQAQVKYTLLDTLLQKYAYHFWEKNQTLPLVISQKKNGKPTFCLRPPTGIQSLPVQNEGKVSTVEFPQSFICWFTLSVIFLTCTLVRFYQIQFMNCGYWYSHGCYVEKYFFPKAIHP